MFLLVSLMNEKCEDQVVSSNDNFVKMETDQTVVHGKWKIFILKFFYLKKNLFFRRLRSI